MHKFPASLGEVEEGEILEGSTKIPRPNVLDTRPAEADRLSD